MSTAGSTRSAAGAPYTPAHDAGPEARRRRTAVFRWRGIIPIALLLAGAAAVWATFGDRLVRDTLSEAGTEALGAQLDIGAARVSALAARIELRGVALADPFDRTRNLFEAARLVVELEPRPLLEKKVIVRRLGVENVRTGTPRATPARAVTGGGFAPQALTEVRRFMAQFDVPALSLANLGALKDVVLDPSRLRAVQAAGRLAQRADSTKAALEDALANLRIQQTIDSSTALLARLQGANVRTLGIDGARRAIADIRAAVARVDSARGRVDAVTLMTRRGIDSLRAGVSAIDSARLEDYRFARGLLQLPSIEGPDMGAALFGKVSIDRFQHAMYWATLARQYAPPGLLPREETGPKRLRRSGSTIHFVEPRSDPRFLLRRANLDVTVTDGEHAGRYSVSASDVTSDPALVGRPTLFALRRVPQRTGGGVDSLFATGSIDHVGGDARETVNLRATGFRLPLLPIPALPYTLDPGRGVSEMRFVLDGERIAARWHIQSSDLRWRADSARLVTLNPVETLLARVLTGVSQLELTTEIGGTVRQPTLRVRSNLDRQIADRIRSVMGDEIAAAQTRVRAQVDRLVEERAAPVRARVAEVRSDGERRVAEARARLDGERRKLEERLRSLSAGVVNLPGIPGD